MAIITITISSLVAAVTKLLTVGLSGIAVAKGIVTTTVAATFVGGVSLGYMIRSTPRGVRTILMGVVAGAPGMAVSLAEESFR